MKKSHRLRYERFSEMAWGSKSRYKTLMQKGKVIKVDGELRREYPSLKTIRKAMFKVIKMRRTLNGGEEIRQKETTTRTTTQTGTGEDS